ncbi:hypothetical protein ABWL39_03865 [Chitinivorax sp. PXF-14]|uniref:hypothetical protein n=1 Tax=Chitinivorax sp. PXF-14 TaxID=3230488 RepID=UPI0034663EA2
MKMSSFTRTLLLISVSSLSLQTYAANNCQALLGLIRLDADATCTITTAYPGNAYLGAPGTCFKARITGLGSGYAGLTSETVFGVDQGHTAMPSGAIENNVQPIPDGSPVPFTRRFITGRTVIRTAAGNLYSADAGVVSSSGTAEQAVITGGTGKYAGATGYIYALGNYIGQWGTYLGQLCLAG